MILPVGFPLPKCRKIRDNSRRAFMRRLSLVFPVELVVACEKVPTRDPPDLARVFHPIFARELLATSQLLGLAMNLQNPVKARVLIKVNSSTSATDLAQNLHGKPQQWLRLEDSRLLLTPSRRKSKAMTARISNCVFSCPKAPLAFLLERLAKTDIPQAVAAY